MCGIRWEVWIASGLLLLLCALLTLTVGGGAPQESRPLARAAIGARAAPDDSRAEGQMRSSRSDAARTSSAPSAEPSSGQRYDPDLPEARSTRTSTFARIDRRDGTAEQPAGRVTQGSSPATQAKWTSSSFERAAVLLAPAQAAEEAPYAGSPMLEEDSDPVDLVAEAPRERRSERLEYAGRLARFETGDQLVDLLVRRRVWGEPELAEDPARMEMLIEFAQEIAGQLSGGESDHFMRYGSSPHSAASPLRSFMRKPVLLDEPF